MRSDRYKQATIPSIDLAQLREHAWEDRAPYWYVITWFFRTSSFFISFDSTWKTGLTKFFLIFYTLLSRSYRHFNWSILQNCEKDEISVFFTFWSQITSYNGEKHLIRKSIKNCIEWCLLSFSHVQFFWKKILFFEKKFFFLIKKILSISNFFWPL